MKTILIALFAIVPALAWSGETLQFDSIRLNELAKLGFTQVLESDYIADNEFNNDQKNSHGLP